MTGESIEPRVLVRSEQTSGELGVVDLRVPGGWPGPPLHHHAFDEFFYVLEGELTFQIGAELVRAEAGGFVFAPRDHHHTVANLAPDAARYLLLITPGGFERYFDRIAADTLGTPLPPEASKSFPPTIVVGPTIADRGRLDDARVLPTERSGVNVLLTGPASGEALAVMANTVPAHGGGPPLHHHVFDETFYVLDGELWFQLGDELIKKSRGELVFAGRGEHHTFANLSGAPARMLLACNPPGFERYFMQLAAKQAGLDPPPEALEPWPEVTVVGPPISDDDAHE